MKTDHIERNPNELDTQSLLWQAQEDVALTLSKLLAEEEMTKAELANRLGKSPAWVSRLMNAQMNLTLKSIVGVFAVFNEHLLVTTDRIRDERVSDAYQRGLTAGKKDKAALMKRVESAQAKTRPEQGDILAVARTHS